MLSALNKAMNRCFKIRKLDPVQRGGDVCTVECEGDSFVTPLDYGIGAVIW